MKTPENINLSDFGPSRIKFIEKAYAHLASLGRPVNILETGCARESGPSFTGLFGYLLKNHTGGQLTTIDNDFNHIRASQELNSDYSGFINYICADSVSTLLILEDSFIKSIDLFILDSYDIDLLNQRPSATHHLKEALAFFHRTNPQAWIAIDDNFLPGSNLFQTDGNGNRVDFTNDCLIGKGSLCDIFLTKNGWSRDNSVLVHGDRNIFLYYKS